MLHQLEESKDGTNVSGRVLMQSHHHCLDSDALARGETGVFVSGANGHSFN